mmetsp:Transcript_67519/g.197550  ORF Transcript_67519/g.197550 Transcript_67519/m.197550 type:complete len:644 (+) Transcript_67519:69-2000(+)
MSAQTQVWVWQPANGEKEVAFQHPSDLPYDDEATAKARFLDQIRGPRLARISPATILQSKGQLALIAEQGATREVPKSVILPWYEGLLLLEELEAVQGADASRHPAWCNSELKAVLDQERSKFRNGLLSSALYTEKRLITTAVTGARFSDADDKEWTYRRENLRPDEKLSLTEGEDAGGFFKIRDIIGYLPPWEAFCHEKCGLYQDFYAVRWEFPHSEVDYSRVENGCAGTIGATWEPDECIPAHLDPLRVGAKRAWIKKRREKEQRLADERTRSQMASKRRAEPEPPPAAAKRPSPEAQKAPEPVKRARIKRDGTPLERDLFRSARGHDFAPGDGEKSFTGVRTGWPKKPEEYPKGFGCADPPGFCWEGCDCMDDQRPQRSWETNKAWLEDNVRNAAALTAIDTLSQQTRFVRRRGQVTKMCFFETPQTVLPNQVHSRAALDLATVIERGVMKVLSAMPLPSLAASREVRAHIPARAVLFEDLDYEPLRFDASLPAGEELPTWLRVDADDGRLITEDTPQLSKPLQMKVEFLHAEGPVGAVPFSIVPSGPALWTDVTPGLAQRFADVRQCPLEVGAREALAEQFSEVYDFSSKSSRERTLGEWLEAMSTILRMLRSTAVSNVSLAAVHKAPPQKASAQTRGP